MNTTQYDLQSKRRAKYKGQQRTQAYQDLSRRLGEHIKNLEMSQKPLKSRIETLENKLAEKLKIAEEAEKKLTVALNEITRLNTRNTELVKQIDEAEKVIVDINETSKKSSQNDADLTMPGKKSAKSIKK